MCGLFNSVDNYTANQGMTGCVFDNGDEHRTTNKSFRETLFIEHLIKRKNLCKSACHQQVANDLAKYLIPLRSVLLLVFLLITARAWVPVSLKAATARSIIHVASSSVAKKYKKTTLKIDIHLKFLFEWDFMTWRCVAVLREVYFR